VRFSVPLSLLDLPVTRVRFEGEACGVAEDNDPIEEFQQPLVRLAPLMDVPGRVNSHGQQSVR
jgi:hypothetical protein